MVFHDGATSDTPIDVATSLLLYFTEKDHVKANTRAIIQSFVLPNRKLKKTAEEAEAQYKSEYFLSLDEVYYYTCDRTPANNSHHGSQ